MRINVQIEEGRPETVTIEQFVVENHPAASASGPCKTCLPKDQQPVREAGFPPFHPSCVCTVEWREI